jgi:hypothetical protein
MVRACASRLRSPSHRTAAICGIYSSARAGASAAARGCIRCHRPGSRASAAGVTWTSRTAKAEWAGRRYHTSVVDAAGAIYVIGGGTDFSGTHFHDVYASTDGGARLDYVKGVWSGEYTRGYSSGYSSGYSGATEGY